MQHMQPLADLLLPLVREGSPLWQAWSEASAKTLHSRDHEEVVDSLESLPPEVETGSTLWGLYTNFDTSSADAVYVKVHAVVFGEEPAPHTSSFRYSLIFRFGVSTTNPNVVNVIGFRTYDSIKKVLFERSMAFKAKSWNSVSKGANSPEAFLKKVLEEFDKKGFGLKGITRKSVAASVIAASDPVYYTEVPAESVPSVVRFLEKSPMVKITRRKKTDSGFVAVYFSIPANIKPSKIQTDLRLATSRRELEVLPDRSAKKPKATQKSPIPKMQVPGCKVTVPYGLASAVRGALKKMQKSIEMQGEDDGSTKYSLAFHIDSKFDIHAFEDQLRDELGFSGFMEVSFFDLVEE